MTDSLEQLTRDIARLCHQRGAEEVLGACMNIIVTCIRQNYGRRADVEAKMRDLHERGMIAVLEHYDPVSGRRRTVVPFDQVITAAHVGSATRFPVLGRNNGGGRNGGDT